MPPIPLCRQATPGSSTSPTSSDNKKGEVLCTRANGFSYQAIKRRPEHTPANLDPISQNDAEIDPFFQSLTNWWPSLKPFRDRRISSLNHPSQPMLIPLDECILAILWEAFDCPLSQRIIGNAGHTLIMMRAAAIYQAKTDTVRHLQTFSPWINIY